MKPHNYKNEAFHSMASLDADLHGIVTQIEKNFKNKDLYLAVSEFTRGESKKKLKEFVEKIYNLPQNHISEKKKSKDYPGLYVFAEVDGDDIKTAYVGISRMVIQRLKQHSSYSHKNSGTWAYLMAKFPDGEKVPVTDKKKAVQFDKSNPLNEAIIKVQTSMAKKYVVTYYPMDDNFLLHLAEPYVACALGAYWNSFETH